jgi:hypothetical protein
MSSGSTPQLLLYFYWILLIVQMSLLLKLFFEDSSSDDDDEFEMMILSLFAATMSNKRPKHCGSLRRRALVCRKKARHAKLMEDQSQLPTRRDQSSHCHLSSRRRQIGFCKRVCHRDATRTAGLPPVQAAAARVGRRPCWDASGITLSYLFPYRSAVVGIVSLLAGGANFPFTCICWCCSRVRWQDLLNSNSSTCCRRFNHCGVDTFTWICVEIEMDWMNCNRNLHNLE